MTISKSVLAQWLAHALALAVGWLAARQGVHMSPTASAEVAAVVSLIAGPAAGVLVKVEPSADAMISQVERLLAVVAESGSNARSALSAAVRPSAADVVATMSPSAPTAPSSS
jgi:multidrug resistance efflux pump